MIRNTLLTVAMGGLLLGAAALVHAEDSAAKLNDSQITQDVKARLAADEPAVAPRIVVITHDGVVTLDGLNLSPGEILTAVHDANGIDGVVRVENHLKVG